MSLTIVLEEFFNVIPIFARKRVLTSSFNSLVHQPFEKLGEYPVKRPLKSV